MASGATVYLKDLNTRLPHIAAAFSDPIGLVTHGRIEDWLRSLPGSLRSRNNYRCLVVTLWRFGRRRGYFATEADMLPRTKDNGAEIEIIPPEDFAKLIVQADAKLVPFSRHWGVSRSATCRTPASGMGGRSFRPRVRGGESQEG
jgi:hypothetical protein